MDNPDKSVLIITYDMIPYAPWGGCQRMYFLARYLQAHSYKACVVHKKTNKDCGNYGNEIDFTTVPVGSSKKNSFNGGDYLLQEDATRGALNLAISSFLKKVLKLFFVPVEKQIFHEPNSGIGVFGYAFTKKARTTIFKIIEEWGVKKVIISAPPFSLFDIAPHIKKRFPGVHIILDYRDPWNTPRSSYFLSSRKEQKILQSVDKVVFVNDKMLQDISSLYPIPKEKSEVVLNGYSGETWSRVDVEGRAGRDRMVISYVGSATFQEGHYVNISPFLEAFETFSKDRNVVMKLIGVTPPVTGTIKREYRNVEFIPPVHSADALAYMMESDVLLLLYSDEKRGRYMLTGKFFDYVRSGKVLFGTSKTEDTYFLEMIKEHSLGVGCLYEPSEIIRSLEYLYENWEQGTLSRLRQDKDLDIESFSRDAQNSRYLDILNGFDVHTGT